MYQLSFTGSKLCGHITLPMSKSMSSRLLIINSIGNLNLDLTSLSESTDTQTLGKLLSSMDRELDVMDGGTTARFIIAHLAATGRAARVTGSPRMQKRPVKGLIEALTQLGAEISYEKKEGFLPIQLHGGALKNNEVTVRGDISSQFISALLLVAPTLENGLTISLAGEIVSMPYIKMTLSMMRHYGINCDWNQRVIRVEPGPYKPNTAYLERDWSAASYWYGLAALAPAAEITLSELREESIQGDSIVKEMYHGLGVKTQFNEKGCLLTKTQPMTRFFSWDFSDCPDLAQTAITTCAGLGINGLFKGLTTLERKETNRIDALQKELAKTSVALNRAGEGAVELLCSDQQTPHDFHFATHNDHRMAMALAALCMRKPVYIDNPGVVAKSYPGFWRELEGAGVTVQPLP